MVDTVQYVNMFIFYVYSSKNNLRRLRKGARERERERESERGRERGERGERLTMYIHLKYKTTVEDRGFLFQVYH